MLHERATARDLAMARIVVFGLAAWSRLLCPLWEVCYLPDYYPVGIMRLLGASWWVPRITLPVAVGLQALTIALLLAAAAGFGNYRRIAPLACFALTVAEGMVRGRGVIPHAHMVLLLTSYILCFFPAADAFTVSRQPGQRSADPAIYRAALLSASLVFCFTYLLAATRRLSAGGLAIYLDDTILCATANRDAELGSIGGLGLWACESFAMAWALRIGFPIVTLVELLSPLVVVSRWFRWLWIAVMVPFHIGTGLLMGIWFPYNLALIPILVTGAGAFRIRDLASRAEPDEDPIKAAALSRAA